MATYSEAVLADSPVSYWRLGEPSGATANDEQNANDGTYINTPTLGTAGLLADDADTAVDFDWGSDEYLKAKTTGGILCTLTNVSVELWIKTSSGNVGALYVERPGSGNDIWNLELSNTGILRFWHRNDAGTLTQINSTASALNDGATHHIVFTKSGTSIAFYVDGSPAGTGTLNGNDTLTEAGIEAWIGRDKLSGNNIDAILDEVAIYNTTLGATRVAAHYDIGVNGPSADPPVVVTGAASDIVDTTATLNGTVDANGAATTYYFEYGETVAYGTSIPAGENGNAGSGADPVAVDEAISGLTPSTTYHFRLVATNSGGTNTGDDATFDTLAAPPPTYFRLRTRENPPLRLHILATAPNGNTFRWGEDERRPDDVFKGLSFSTVMPGGFETMECTLPRKTRVNYQDLTRLSTLTVKGAGGQVAGEYRLEKTPRSSGLGERSIKPQAVGWQAHLDDDNEAAEIYVDRDLNAWTGMARERQKDNYDSGWEVLEDGSVSPDTSTGIPAVVLTITGTSGDAVDHLAESWYDAGSACYVKDIYYDYTSKNTTAGYSGIIGTSSDDIGTASSATADLLTGADSSGTNTGYAQTFTAYRFAFATFSVSNPAEGDHVFNLRRLTLWGNHGLTKRGTAPSDGLYASDVIANALSRWCPLLHFTTGSDGTIKPTSFIVPQLSFREFTTAAEILTQSNRFHLWDWAVWEGQRDAEPTFYYNERNGRGKRWRARVAPSNLQETGPQVDRLFNGIIVSYQDVDGTSKTVGPTGSLADATSSDLIDTDPLNPVNQLGMRRYGTLDMGIVSTSAGATEVGRQFLERSKELDQSGSADLVGYVTDDHGVNRPSWAVRAGDQISFVDSSDPSYRRVVHTAYDHSSRTNSIDLDSPPEGMDALLEELGAVLVLGTPPPTPVGSG